MIYEKLQKARVQLQNKKLKKSGKNNYANFDYFQQEDFMPSLNEIFLELKMSSNFSMTQDLATLTIIDFEDEKTAVFTSPIAELDLKGCNKIQALGGTHTYIKRYLYLNALEIVESDLFDPLTGKEKDDKNKGKNQNPTPPGSLKSPEKKAIETPASKLFTKLKNANLNEEQMQQFCIIYNLSSKNPQGIKDFMADEKQCDNTIINYLKEIA